ncbi:MAG: hypothetical protein ACKOCQ_04180 [Candidatus Nitrosotenuis sp.]
MAQLRQAIAGNANATKILDQIEAKHKELKESRESMKSDMQGKRESMKEGMKEMRDAMKEDIKGKRDTMREGMKDMKGQMKKMPPVDTMPPSDAPADQAQEQPAQ